jgi:hypothetical protein
MCIYVKGARRYNDSTLFTKDGGGTRADEEVVRNRASTPETTCIVCKLLSGNKQTALYIHHNLSIYVC